MSNRRHINDMGKLIDNNGTVVNEISKIESEAINLFNTLYNLDQCLKCSPIINAKYLHFIQLVKKFYWPP